MYQSTLSYLLRKTQLPGVYSSLEMSEKSNRHFFSMLEGEVPGSSLTFLAHDSIPRTLKRRICTGIHSIQAYALGARHRTGSIWAYCLINGSIESFQCGVLSGGTRFQRNGQRA